MNRLESTLSGVGPSQLDLSRTAARAYALACAARDHRAAEGRAHRLARIPMTHRLRRTLAARLIATARLIDAT